MAFGSANAQHNGLTAREVLISGDYNGNPTPVAVSSTGVLQAVTEEEPLTDAAGSQPTVAVDDDPSVVLAAADPTRVRLYFYNNGPNTVYLNKDAAAVSTTGQPLVMGGTFIFTGADAKRGWQGICAAAETAVIRRQVGVRA